MAQKLLLGLSVLIGLVVAVVLLSGNGDRNELAAAYTVYDATTGAIDGSIDVTQADCKHLISSSKIVCPGGPTEIVGQAVRCLVQQRGLTGQDLANAVQGVLNGTATCP